MRTSALVVALVAALALTACGGAVATPTRRVLSEASTATATIGATNTPIPPAATAVPTTKIPATATATSPPATATATKLPPTATTIPTPAPTKAPEFKSGGFGKTRSDWEKVYQKPEKELAGMFTYANGNYIVLFTDGRVSYLEHPWGDQNAKSRDFAEGAATPFLPADGKKVKEYKSTRSGNTVVLYHSESLAGIFTPDAFIGGEPGDFIVIYRDITGKVTSFVIGLGNNP